MVKNIIGQKFGRLTVIKNGAGTTQTGGYNITTWICRCDCGGTKELITSSLTTGKVKSCGCLIHEVNLSVIDTLRQKNTIWTPLEASARKVYLWYNDGDISFDQFI